MTNKDFRKLIAQNINRYRNARNYWKNRLKKDGHPWRPNWESYTDKIGVLRVIGWAVPKEKI